MCEMLAYFQADREVNCLTVSGGEQCGFLFKSKLQIDFKKAEVVRIFRNDNDIRK